MKYRIATIPTFDRETRTEGEAFFRENDGTLVIMHGDSRKRDEDTRRAVLVPRVTRLKRTAPYDTPDPEQEALAQRLVDLLNADA
jgi:hypothetical protein